MRNLSIKLVLVLFSLIINKLSVSQDLDRSIRFGVIPYQICSRGPALYFSKDFIKSSIELRPSYTIATNWVTVFFPTKHDKYFFRGINLQVLFDKRRTKKYFPKLITGLRYWWYDKQYVYSELDVPVYSSYAKMEYKSKWKVGFMAGIEIDKQFDFDSFDFAIFLNGGVNFFEGKEYLHNTANGIVLDTYKRISKAESAEAFLAAGIKLGYRKKLKPSIHQE